MLAAVTAAVGADQVLAVAPTAVAAATLGQALGVTADTAAKLVGGWPPTAVPAGGLVIVDEAGQCDTRTLAAVCGKAAQVGARVVLVGDAAQQGSISAGGLFAALTDTGALLATVALGELWRFDDPAEAAATVELRRGRRDGDGAGGAGDGDGLTFYRDRGRVSFSSHTDVAGLAQAWWSARRDRQVIISCATTALMNNVNTAIAAARHRAGETGAVITGSGDNIVRVGDVITTRRNNRDLIDTTGHWVRNGDRWITVGVAGDGGVVLQRTTPTTNPNRPDLYGAGGGGAGGGGDRRGSVVVGEDYFADHVELGYAITTTRAQSVSTDASLTVIDAGTSLPELYVGLTRGAGDNHLIVVADELAFDDDHPAAAADPNEVLAAVLARRRPHHTAVDATRRGLPAAVAADHLAVVAATAHDNRLPTLAGVDVAAIIAEDTQTRTQAVAEGRIYGDDDGVEAAIGHWLAARHEDTADDYPDPADDNIDHHRLDVAMRAYLATLDTTNPTAAGYHQLINDYYPTRPTPTRPTSTRAAAAPLTGGW